MLMSPGETLNEGVVVVAASTVGESGLSGTKVYIEYTEQKHSCLGMVPPAWQQIVSCCLVPLPSKECCSDKTPICPCFRKPQIEKKPIMSALV